MIEWDSVAWQFYLNTSQRTGTRRENVVCMAWDKRRFLLTENVIDASKLERIWRRCFHSEILNSKVESFFVGILSSLMSNRFPYTIWMQIFLFEYHGRSIQIYLSHQINAPNKIHSQLLTFISSTTTWGHMGRTERVRLLFLHHNKIFSELLFFLSALVEGSASLQCSILTTPFRSYSYSQAQLYRFDAVCHCTNPYRSVYLFWFSMLFFSALCLPLYDALQSGLSTYEFLPFAWRTNTNTNAKMVGDRVRLLNFIYMILIALFMVFCDDSQNRIEKKGETSALRCALSNSFFFSWNAFIYMAKCIVRVAIVVCTQHPQCSCKCTRTLMYKA